MFKAPLKPNAALARIRKGEVLNVFVAGGFATPRLIDFVGQAGVFDVIWFDLEHFDIPTQDLAIMTMVAQSHGLNTIARIKAADYQVVMRTLETGVDGIMCAMVADAAEARNIVEWAMFNDPNPSPGEAIGNRGWNSGNIDGRYANIPPLEYVKYKNLETIVLCQIETEQAVANAEEIVSVPGVSGLFFGPGDYSTGIGFPAQITHPRVYEAMGKVAEAAQKSGKWWGTVAAGKEMYAKAKSLGGRFLCPGGDVRVMNMGIRGLWESFQETAPVPAPVVSPKPVTYS